MTFIQECTDALVRGHEGDVVIERIKQYYNTHYSFEKNVSNVRRLFLHTETRHPEYKQDCQAVLKSLTSDEDTVIFRRFMALSLPNQYDMWSKRHKKSLFQEHNEHYIRLRLLPDNMATFKTSESEMQVSAKRKVETLLERNNQRIVVPDATNVLAAQQAVLREGSRSKIHEIIALLLMSGRRECELLNGKSMFEPVDGHPYHTRFTGALKKKHDPMQDHEDTSIVIPLLCTFESFLTAYERMQCRQGDDIHSMSNKEISARYCSQINAALKKTFSMLTKPHDLRGVYAKYVDLLFEHDASFPRVCMFCLGHDVLQDSLHYMIFELNNLTVSKTLGGLDMEKFSG